MNTFKTRRCDSRCHNAKGKRCNCWCQGRHHGLGSKKAIEIYLEDIVNDPVSPFNVEFIPDVSSVPLVGFRDYVSS